MQVVIRSLSVLSLLARRPAGLTLAEIADQLALPPATAHRITGLLEQQGFLTRSPSSRRYFLGPAARELAGPDKVRQSSLVTAHPAIAAAGRKTGETVFLCEFMGDRAVCTALTESSFPLRLFVRVGQSMPLHAAASARVLLAWQPRATIERLLAGIALTAYTPGTPATVNAVIDHLELVRRRGYDVCESELDDNVRAVSAPVRSVSGEVTASLTLAAPAHRMATQDEHNGALEVMLASAREMSTDLGWEPPAGPQG